MSNAIKKLAIGNLGTTRLDRLVNETLEIIRREKLSAGQKGDFLTLLSERIFDEDYPETIQPKSGRSKKGFK